MLVKNILIGLALLCLIQTAAAQTATNYSIYDVLIDFNEDRSKVILNRNYTLQRTVRFIAPAVDFTRWICKEDDPSVEGQGNLLFEISNEDGFVSTVNFTSAQEDIEFENLEPGYYDLSLTYIFTRDDGEKCKNDRLFDRIIFEVRQENASDYNDLRPDEVRSYTTSFTPPFSNTYPVDSDWAKYNNPSTGNAIATIKLGEGNTEITRPIFMIDGVDFREETVTDPALNGAVVRYGSQGWENICQGLVARQKRPEVLEPDLFSEYPTILSDLLSGQDEKGEANFDVILVDFEDGADYVQKNAQLLRAIIEDVNSSKACGYKNVLVGLSMGGQVAKFALSSMEADSVDHDFSHYISYDSPHKDANVPLALQAFLYAGSRVAGLAEATENWYSLNRPGAVQLLRFNLIEMIENNTIDFDHKSRLVGAPWWGVDFQFVGHNHQQLHDHYTQQRDEFGLPEETINVAIANGSGAGQEQYQATDLPDCLFDVELEINLTNPWIDQLGVESATFTLQMNVAGSAADTLMFLKVFSPRDYHFHEVLFLNNSSLLELDSAPGCRRNDIGDIRNQLTDLGRSAFGLVSLIPDHSKPFSTFMPTASVLNVETDNLTLNLKEAILNGDVIVPFDEFYIPTENEDHVISNAPNRGFLLQMVNNGVLNLANTITLPSLLKGTAYNYGRNNDLIANFVINEGASLLVNKKIQTGYVDTYPEGNVLGENFRATTRNNCSNISVLINPFGLFELGDETKSAYSGEVIFDESSHLTLHPNSTLNLYNNSQIIFENNSTFTISEGANISLFGEDTKLILGGDLILDGDVEIFCEGIFVLQESASISGGKLTINGVHIDDELILIHGQHNIESSIEINNGRIRFVNDAVLTISSALGEQNKTATLNNVRISQESYTSTFLTCIKFQDLLEVNIDNLRAIQLTSRTIFTIREVAAVQLKNISIQNCYRGIIVNEVQEMTLEDSRFKSTPQTANGITIEYSQGVSISNAYKLLITNSTWDGFGEDDDFTPQLHALKLHHCPLTEIVDSEFTNNAIGILSPKSNNVPNFTNLYISSSKFSDNERGIELYGHVTADPTELYSGYVSLECVELLDNLIGVYGEDILIQADYYYADEEANPNTFRARGSFNFFDDEPGSGSVIFNIKYTEHTYDEIFLRGNIWYNFASYESFRNADGTYATVVKNPGIDVPHHGQTPICSTVIIGEEEVCIGCFQEEDDNDCTFSLSTGETNIAAQYRQANDAVRNRDFALASELFEPLAIIGHNNSIGSSAPKCNYQTHIARIFALPSETQAEGKAGIRSKREDTFTITPNPSSSFITLEGMTDSHIRIYSANGEEVLSVNFTSGASIDISHLSAGMYIVRSNSSTETKKFIVLK